MPRTTSTASTDVVSSHRRLQAHRRTEVPSPSLIERPHVRREYLNALLVTHTDSGEVKVFVREHRIAVVGANGEVVSRLLGGRQDPFIMDPEGIGENADRMADLPLDDQPALRQFVRQHGGWKVDQPGMTDRVRLNLM
ncbi:MAG: hypothetical protein WCI96_13845, partial [Planctomycetota bacterium]